MKKQVDPLQKFGTILKSLRETANWTQDELAGELGCDRAYISQLERGLKNPSLVTMIKLGKALDVKVVFGGESFEA